MENTNTTITVRVYIYGFTDEMLDEAYNAAEKNKEVMRIEKMFRCIYADDKKLEAFNELRAHQGFIHSYQIEEIAGEQ